MSILSECLDYFVKKKEQNIAELAKKCRVDRSTMYQYIRGKHPLQNQELLETILAELRLTPEERSKAMQAFEVTHVGEEKYYRRKKVKELFASLLFPEGVFFEDHAVLYKWVAMCTKVVWVDKVYYYYYQRDGSICHTLDMNKHYHFFMAEYPRLDFVKEKRLFSEKERGAIIKMIAQTCFYHFSDFMQEAKFLRDRKQIKDMRVRMRKWLSLPSDEIDKKLYKRIRKITYFWPIYYWKHYARKKRE